MGDPSYVYPAPDMPPYDRGPAVVTDENQSQSLQSDHSRGSFGPQRFANTLASGKVKEQRLKSRLGGDIAVFIEMDDGGGDVFLSGRVSPRLPASGARVTFRLSLTAERRWVAKNGEWLYEGFLAQAARPVPRRPGARVEGVVSTRKPSSACCWITIGDLDGGVYCLSKWCPGAASPPLGAIVSCELKQGKYGDWRVASPPGLAVVTQEARFLETGRLFDDAPPSPRSGADLWHAAPAYYPPARADPRAATNRTPPSPGRSLAAGLSSLLGRVSLGDPNKPPPPDRREAPRGPRAEGEASYPPRIAAPPRIIDDRRDWGGPPPPRPPRVLGMALPTWGAPPAPAPAPRWDPRYDPALPPAMLPPLSAPPGAMSPPSGFHRGSAPRPRGGDDDYPRGGGDDYPRGGDDDYPRRS